jgi:long-chain acyl-CoA synthetase
VIAQIFVYGDSLQNFLVSIIVPDMIQVKAFAEQKGLSEAQVLAGKEYKDIIIKAMEAKAKEYALNSLERIKAIYLTPEAFTVENDIITPTFKIKRNIAKKVYAEQITQMYAETNAELAAKEK